MDEPVRLMIASNEPEAEIVCGLLRERGIRCSHRITNIGFGAGGEVANSGSGPREVLVRSSELEAARAAVAEATRDADAGE